MLFTCTRPVKLGYQLSFPLTRQVGARAFGRHDKEMGWGRRFFEAQVASLIEPQELPAFRHFMRHASSPLPQSRISPHKRLRRKTIVLEK